MSENLWPDFNAGQMPRSPKAVIEAAGRGLKEKTGGLVQFTQLGTASIKDNDAQVAFSLYSQPLSYHYPFMRARFAVSSLYPVTVVADKMPEVVANDENQLIAALATIFKAPSTVDTIQRLMSLAQQ
jgi:hypothetical protein